MARSLQRFFRRSSHDSITIFANRCNILTSRNKHESNVIWRFIDVVSFYFGLQNGLRRCISGGNAGRKTVVDQKVAKVVTEKTTSWVPDPVTGYYRPANRSVEIDPAELRKLLLSHKSRN